MQEGSFYGSLPTNLRRTINLIPKDSHSLSEVKNKLCFALTCRFYKKYHTPVHGSDPFYGNSDSSPRLCRARDAIVYCAAPAGIFNDDFRMLASPFAELAAVHFPSRRLKGGRVSIFCSKHSAVSRNFRRSSLTALRIL